MSSNSTINATSSFPTSSSSSSTTTTTTTTDSAYALNEPSYITRLSLTSSNSNESTRYTVYTHYFDRTKSLRLFILPSDQRNIVITYYAFIESIISLKPSSLIASDQNYIEYLLKALRNIECDNYIYELNTTEKQLYIGIQVGTNEIKVLINIAKLQLTAEYIPKFDNDNINLVTANDGESRKKHCENYARVSYMFVQEMHRWIHEIRHKRHANADFSSQLTKLIEYSNLLVDNNECEIEETEELLCEQISKELNAKKSIIRQKRERIEALKSQIEEARQRLLFETKRKKRMNKDGYDDDMDNDNYDDLDNMPSDETGNTTSEEDEKSEALDPVNTACDPEPLDTDLEMPSTAFSEAEPISSLNVDYLNNEMSSEMQSLSSFPMPSSLDIPQLQSITSSSSSGPANSSSPPIPSKPSSSCSSTSLSFLNTDLLSLAPKTAAVSSSVRKRARVNTNSSQNQI